MKIYLSGPMSGYDNYNFPAFDYAADKLRAEGHIVFSPADNDRTYGLTGETGKPFPPGITARTLLKDDCSWICDHAEMVVMLPVGWEKSPGANCERFLAKAIGMLVAELGRSYHPPQEYVDAWNADAPRKLVEPHNVNSLWNDWRKPR